MANLRCIFLTTLVLVIAGANARQLLQEPSGGGENAPQWNETGGQARRSVLGFGQSTPVSTTFYNTPGTMDCADALGQCGYGSDVGGPATDGNGGKFVAKALYPLHAASGNFEFLGGCGACGILSGNGVSKGYVITDVTDHLDSLDRSSSSPPEGSHIDICLNEFKEYVPGTDGNHGGIFTGTWTRVDCSTMGAPNYPNHDLVVRYEAYNDNAKAVVVSRAPGAGVITGVTFVTAADNNGGHSGNDSPVEHPGSKVAGWGAWWTPGSDLSNRGGVRLVITMEDGQVITQDGYPLPDFKLWKTGQLITLKWHSA